MKAKLKPVKKKMANKLLISSCQEAKGRKSWKDFGARNNIRKMEKPDFDGTEWTW